MTNTKTQKRSKILFVLLNLFASIIAYGQNNNTSNSIIDASSIVKVVFNGAEGFILEGPAMAPDGTIYFTDISITAFEGMKAGIIWNYNPQSGETKVFRSPSGMANGLAFDREGNLIACEGADFGGRRIIKTDMTTGKSIIMAGLYRDKPFNAPNDLVLDNVGRIYFTDTRFFGHEPIDQPLDGIYRIDTNGSTKLVIANASKPNGIALSPDYRKLYTACDLNGKLSGFLREDFKGPVTKTNGAILEYYIQPDGSIEYKGVLINLGDEGPDGIKVDKEGNLYVALRSRIGVFSAQGKELTSINIPSDFVTNMCFGRGKFENTLFITARKALYTVQVKNQGLHIPFNK